MNSLSEIHNSLASALPDLLASISDISERIWQRGWAEANAGNLSVNLTQMLYDKGIIGNLDNNLFLVSKSGSRYRQISKDPMQSMVVIHDDHVYPNHGLPTSEWHSHLAIHQHFIHFKESCRVILHAHPAELIAISQDTIYQDQLIFNQHLKDILPELQIYLPSGIALVGKYKPGSIELANASCNAITGKKALIWQGHGLLTFGDSIDEAFDYFEIIVKASQLHYLLKR